MHFARGGGGAGAGAFRADNLGHNALHVVGNFFFALFVLGVLIFTIIAATYTPDDPLLHPSSSHMTSFLSSSSNATFRSDSDSAIRTGDDLPTTPAAANAVDSAPFINITDIVDDSKPKSSGDENDTVTESCDASAPIDCTSPETFHTMMRAAIEKFPDVHFYKFGKPVSSGPNECDMAWRFRPRDAKRASFYKDYRRFGLSRSTNCSLIVETIGDYHSGILARKRKNRNKNKDSGGFEPPKKSNFLVNEEEEKKQETVVPVVGEIVNDSLPVIESESKFSSGQYLLYQGGGDRCKSMNHYLWSFLCALGEAQYLNRTLVMDTSLCLSKMYTSSNQDEEGKDFRFYFDFEHLRDSASVLDQREFWSDWAKWQKKDGLNLYLVEDFRVTPMKLASVKDALIMRKFGTVEPDNYWYRVCEGETESVIQRPWHLIWKSRRLLDIVSGIASRLNWDFDSVHVVRGEKAKNPRLWPNLNADTSPDALLTTLADKIDEGRDIYIATDEPDSAFFDPLKDKYTIHLLEDFKDLWDENSEWYRETMNLNNKVPVEFDGYMRVEVDTEVFLRGKKQIETFNDLTNDCKDGVGTCRKAPT